MSTENKYTPHIHAEAIKAWADGKTVEFRRKGDPYWYALPAGYPMWSIGNEYRVTPEEVVDYTVVFECGAPGAKFSTNKVEIWQFYQNAKDKQGFLKRTTVDGKVVGLEFIPK